jgi:putative transposase
MLFVTIQDIYLENLKILCKKINLQYNICMSKIYKAFMVELDPNNKQVTKFKQNAGAARWAYNWALEQKKKALNAKIKVPNYIELSRSLTELRKTEITWSRQVSRKNLQLAIEDCDNAFNAFFKRYNKGFPGFRVKENKNQNFKLANISPLQINGWIKLPKIGKVKLKEKDYLPLDSRILSVTVSSKANRWFASVLIEIEQAELPKATTDILGVDLGIKTLATCSDGTSYSNPKPLKRYLKKLKKLNRQHSKKQKGSNNKEKSRIKLAKLHFKISNIRKDTLHKVTTSLIQRANVLVIEDLSVSDMLKNKGLSLAISDIGFYEFRRQLEYKAKWYGRQVLVADRYFPSSKTCSGCGNVKDKLLLSERTYNCEKCKLSIDRDLNAAINLKQLSTDGLSGIYACEDKLSKEKSQNNLSLKQESNLKLDN